MKSSTAECYTECCSFLLTTERRKEKPRNQENADQGKIMASEYFTGSISLGAGIQDEEKKQKNKKQKPEFKERDQQENGNENNILTKLGWKKKIN